MGKIKKGTVYYVVELMPTEFGDAYKTLVIYDRREFAEALLATLNKNNIDFSVFKILEKTIWKEDA